MQLKICQTLFISLFLFTGTTSAQFSFQREFDVQVTKDALVQLYPWAGGMNFCQFSNIDLNYDGVDDLFIFDRSGDKVLTFIQNGVPGTMDFTYAPQYEQLFPANLMDWALLADFNCDGKADIFSWVAGGCQVYKNTGNATDGLSFALEEPILYYFSALEPLNFLFMNSTDINSFVDVDGDSDIDILMWLPDGEQNTVEYYKNLSMELYGVCDSLKFEQKNRCWGKFQESSTDFDYTLFETTSPCDGLLPGEENWDPNSGRSDRHGGGTLLALDLDASGVLDLIVGDGGSPHLAWLTNDGTAPNMDSNMDFWEMFVPKPDSVHLPNLPATFYVDVDNDGNRDLLVSPQDEAVASHNFESAWLYTNSGADNNPTFDYQLKDFIQGEMIDNGTAAHPVYFDANGDGLKDLLISSRERYDTITMGTKGTIYYYENTGTLPNPEFTLITEDYQNITLMDIGAEKNFYPTFGDLDGDGDEDMILGEYTGWMYFMENTGGAGNPAIFSTFVLLEDDVFSFIQRSICIPKLVDLDHDADFDLVIAGTNGLLEYYENIGTSSAYSFQFVTANLGGVDIGATPLATAYAVPEFIDVGGQWELLVGSLSGDIHYYDNIEGNIGGTWNLVTSSVENINIGKFSSPAVYDINNDNKFEMILGCDRGGVAFYTSTLITDIGNGHLPDANLKIYPNPARTQFIIDLGPTTYKEIINTHIKIYDMSGRLLFDRGAIQQKTIVKAESLARGTYVVEIVDGKKSVALKLLID